MKVRALRGVCVGPRHNLVPGATADIADRIAVELIAMRAVERVIDAPKRAAPEPTPDPIPEPAPDDIDPPRIKTPAKSGRKEK